MPRRNYGNGRKRPTEPGNSGLTRLAHDLSVMNRGAVPPPGTPEPRHRDWCDMPITRIVPGSRGDDLAFCHNCHAARPLVGA